MEEGRGSTDGSVIGRSISEGGRDASPAWSTLSELVLS